MIMIVKTPGSQMDSPAASDPNLEDRPLIMFVTDAKVQVSKILTDFFFRAKDGPKINFFPLAEVTP